MLHTRPNADMTAAVFWQVYVACLMLWGAAYVEKRRNVTGGLTALDILQPACMKPPRVREDGSMEWRYADPVLKLSLIHISEPTRLHKVSRMPSSA